MSYQVPKYSVAYVLFYIFTYVLQIGEKKYIISPYHFLTSRHYYLQYNQVPTYMYILQVIMPCARNCLAMSDKSILNIITTYCSAFR